MDSGQRAEKGRTLMAIKRNRKRHIVKWVALTESENEILKRKIFAAGEPTFQAYALQMLFEGKVIHQDFSELQKLNFEIHKMGNNINQLAKAAHLYQQVSPDDIAELTDELAKLQKEVSNQLYQLSRRGE